MPRIFKGSGSTLRLLIHKCVDYSALSNLKVVLYTTDPEIAVQVTEGIVVEGNKVIFTLPSTAFASMDDGVINYIIEGIIDNDSFSTERQSDYYLKTPASYIAEGGSYQEKYLNVNENGLYEVVPDEGKDAMTKVSVNVDVQPNLGQLNADFVDYDGEGNYWRYGFDDGFDGFNYVKINASAYGEQKRNEGYGQGHSDGIIEGVEVGKAQAGAEAITLDATENGTIYTKYADIPEWTEPATGDGEFYDYLSVTANALGTGYVGDTDTVVEIWFRHNGGNTGNKVILQRYKTTISSYRLYSEGETGQLEINRNKYTFPLPANVFNKIRFSTTGVWVNDVLVSEFAESYTETGNQWEIGGNGNCAQGDYGMIKIDGNVYTPVAGGYLPSAGALLESVSPSSPFTYTFVKVQRPQVLDSLIKQVDVNIKIDPTGLKFGYSSFTKVPDWLGPVTSASNDLANMFLNCNNLSDISALSEWDVSNVTNMAGLFKYCPSLIDATPIAGWDTSNVTDMGNMFGQNTKLTTIPYMNCINVQTSTGYNNYYPIGEYYDYRNLTNVGGFYMKNTWNTNSTGLPKCPNLSYESCINILNALYDFTGNGETPTSTQGTLKVHQNFLDLVGDEISIATNKSWTITA